MRRHLLLLWGVGLVAAVLAVPGEAGATWPGENGRLAVEGSLGGTSVLFVWDIGSTQPDAVTDGSTPAWSPDGSQIAFGRSAGGGSELWVMDADSGNEHRIDVATTSWNTHPTWSPDGSQIAFEGDGDIWVTNPDGSGRARLTDGLSFEAAPVWSPDGSKIAYLVVQFDDFPARTEIWVMGGDGAGGVKLAGQAGWTYDDPSWSPDGSSIAYVRSEHFEDGTGTARDVFVMRSDGSSERNLTNSPGPDENHPVWSPDGTTILFERLGDLWAMDSDGGNQHMIEMPNEIQDVQSLDWERVPVGRFDDVPDTHTFYGDVEWLATEGITKGCNPPYNTMFCPDGQVTRGQMAAFLVRALGYTDDGGGDLFVDDDDSIFEADIDKLKTAGVTKGCNPPANTMYCPDGQVTRGQMAAFLVRALGYSDDGGGDLFIDDDDSIFEADIDKLKTAGVTLGCNPPANTMYCPSSYVTRAQMAAFLHRALTDD